jgi:Zn-dependent peptidase ImmA (M78 family)/DNA-binding XRE family transcriptional regulator
MTPKFITPSVLAWARKRAGLSIGDIAEKFGLEESLVVKWEQGEETPTFRQAQALARMLRVPFGYLFLSKPPRDRSPLPDFRTKAGHAPVEPSPDFMEVLYDTQRKQAWYRERLERRDRPALSFAGKFSLSDSVERVADDIRKHLSIDDELRSQSPNWEDFLRTIIRNAESIGILVMRTGTVCGNSHRPLDVEEFRGFAISDDLAPVVFLNGRDAKAAQIFTFAHEIAHIWIGESGISNPNLSVKSTEQANRTEIFCNRIAAEVLVPRGSFISHWSNRRDASENVTLLARFYRVSSLVVARQGYDLNLMGRDEFYQQLKKSYKGKTSKGGGNYYMNLFARNSPTLTATITRALSEGSILYNEAAMLLGVQVPTLQKLAATL